jgi:hypothetical protein
MYHYFLEILNLQLINNHQTKIVISSAQNAMTSQLTA